MQVIRKVNVNETLEFFMELGIVPKDRNGYIYPNSDQAASVLDVLREEIERLKIRILLSCHIEKIEKKNGGFFIHTDQGTVETDALILAAGSKAAPSTGSDGSGYEYARQLGHSIIKPLPGPGAAALSGKYVQTDGRYPHRGRSKLTGRWHYFGKG